MEDKQAELTVSCLRNIKQRNLKEAVRLCIELNTTYPKNFEGWRLAGIPVSYTHLTLPTKA